MTQFVKGLGANEEDLKFVNMHTMREDAETSAWLTTADDNPYQLVRLLRLSARAACHGVPAFYRF